jgi:serine/threonine-protein kinase
LDLRSGTPLLHYRLVEKLGEGGMGVVWRATDTTLDRDVAIKVLPDVFANDPDRAARFEREAKVLASLNHANITTIHSVHKVDSVRFLVMELAHGQDLATHLALGPLALDETIQIARQIASEDTRVGAESGVVHRDLKPANITVTANGKVELLISGWRRHWMFRSPVRAPTFEVAHASERAHGGRNDSRHRGLHVARAGARQVVDRRADIWAFGCVVYEMLAGKKAFGFGETVTDVLAAVVTRGPTGRRCRQTRRAACAFSWSAASRRTRVKRLRDAGEARIVLDDIVANPSEPEVATAAPRATVVKRSTWKRLIPLGGDSRCADPRCATGPARRKRNAAHLRDVTPARRRRRRRHGESPDGHLARRAHAGVLRASRRYRAAVRAFLRRARSGRAGGQRKGAANPFISPDGQWVAFAANAKLKKVSVRGGPVFELRDLCEGHRAGVWLDDGRPSASELRVAAVRIPAGGAPGPR